MGRWRQGSGKYRLGMPDFVVFCRLAQHLSDRIIFQIQHIFPLSLSREHQSPSLQEGAKVSLMEGIRDGSPAELIHRHTQVRLYVLHGLLESESVSGHNRSGVNVVLDELVRPLQQLRCDDYHGRRAVSHLPDRIADQS